MALHPEQRKRYFPEEAPVAWDPIRRDLEENEDWYRDLVEHSQDLLCVHDLEGRLLSINPVPARLLGYSVEEMLRMPMLDFVDSAIPQSVRWLFARYRAYGGVSRAIGGGDAIGRAADSRVSQHAAHRGSGDADCAGDRARRHGTGVRGEGGTRKQ